MTGEGGSGKTRLALQLATDLAADGWRTMWVEPGQEGTAVGIVRDTGEPAVLVVDYAETMPGLADLLWRRQRRGLPRPAGRAAGPQCRGVVAAAPGRG